MLVNGFLDKEVVEIPKLLPSYRTYTIAQISSLSKQTVLAFHAQNLVPAKRSRSSKKNRKLVIHDFTATDAVGKNIKVTLSGRPIRDYSIKHILLNEPTSLVDLKVGYENPVNLYGIASTKVVGKLRE